MFGKKTRKREGFIKRLRARINRGDSWLTYDLANLVPGGKIDEDSLDELESLLVMADVGIDTTTRIIEDLQKSLARKELTDLDSLRRGLHQSLGSILGPVEQPGHDFHQVRVIPEREVGDAVACAGDPSCGVTASAGVRRWRVTVVIENRILA